MLSNLDNIKIRGIIGGVPQNISYYDDEIENYSHSQESSEKLKKTMGYNEHRVVFKNSTISDFIKPLFMKLKSNYNICEKNIDAVVLITQTPDYPIPATSSLLHGMLDFKKETYCVDINDGCAGFLKGLFEASSIIRNSDCKNVLLITGDVLSRKVSIKDRNSYPLIGDAVCLTLIEKIDGQVDQPYEINFDGSGALALQIPAGGMKKVSSSVTQKLIEDSEGNVRSQEHLVMQGRDVFTFTQTVVIKFLSKFVSEHKLEDCDHFFLHQANKFILERIRKKLKLDETKLPSVVIEEYGNSSSATIPMAMLKAYSGKSLTDINENIVLSGFGIGLSWAAAKMKIENLEFCELMELDL